MYRRGPASNRWFLAFFPYKMAFGASSVALPLFVIRLGGGVVDVGLVTAINVAASIPASIAWARLSDRVGRRKAFIAASFLLNGITFALLAASARVAELMVYSALQGVFVAACTTATGMIVVETFPRARWEREFGVLSFIEGVAWTAGLLLGVASLDLRPLFALSSLLLLLSLALSLIMIEEPKITLERDQLKVVVPRLHRNFPPHIHPPTLRGMLRMCRTLKDGLHRNLAKHYAGTFAVFLGTNLLFTPLPAFMLERGVPEGEVFLIFFLNSASSTIFYLAVAKLSDRLGDRPLLIYALLARGALFLLLAAAAAAPPSPSLAPFMSVVLSAVGLTWSVVAVCTKALTPKLSALMEEGRSVGVYNAVASLGSLAGALLSGLAAYACGYAQTFALSAELMALGAICFFLIKLRRPVVSAARGARAVT
ncbi:MAG: MFS transporter [Candidatus Nezhaarchaeales archaeon]